MPRIEQRGTGLLTREVEVFDGTEMHLFAERFCEVTAHARERTDFAAWLRNALEKAGLPYNHGTSARQALAMPEDRFEHLAFKWLWAFELVEKCEAEIREGRQNTYSLSTLISQAVELGTLKERMWWRCFRRADEKEAPEKMALRGRKVAGGSRNSAQATNARHVPLRERRFARMGELIPSVGVENAARQCEAEGLGGWQAIRRQWDRFKEKPDT